MIGVQTGDRRGGRRRADRQVKRQALKSHAADRSLTFDLSELRLKDRVTSAVWAAVLATYKEGTARPAMASG